MGTRFLLSSDRRPSQLHLEVLRGVAIGTGYHQIAAQIHVSRRTVARLVDDLKQHTGTTGLPELVAEAARRGWLHAAVPASAGGSVALLRPAQLPPGPAGFVGRTTQLAALDGLVSTPRAHAARSTVALIRGTAGVGKTTLAVHWAHRVSRRFPDGQLYLNLRGYDRTSDPMTTHEAMKILLGALTPMPDRFPDTIEALQGWYRSILADRRVLIVLDNARDAEQIRPLLPAASGCLVLITSREQLPGLIVTDHVQTIDLDVLPESHARELLGARLGRHRVAAEPDAVHEVINRCARLPLALAVLAAKAATQPTFPLSTLAAQLRDTRSSLEVLDGGDTATDVRAVLSWSYRTLSLDAARMFRLLGTHCSTDFTLSAAASLIGLPTPLARRLLGELTRAHMACELAPDRYGIHDLLRALAQETTAACDSEPDAMLATHRLLDHYLHSTHHADQLLQEHIPTNPIQLQPVPPTVTVEQFADRDQAMSWLVTERPVLVAAVRRAAELGFPLHAWQLAWGFNTFMSWHGHHRERVDTLQTALSAAANLGDLAGQGRIHRALAYATAHHRSLDDALPHFTKALDIFTQLDDISGCARIRHDLASLHSHNKRHPDALEHATMAYELYEKANDRDGMARSLNASGWATSHLGDHEQALALCRRALALLQDTPHYPEYAYTLDSIGHIYSQLGDVDQAIAHYERAIDALDTFSDRAARAEILIHLGDAHRAARRPDVARDHWRKALRTIDETSPQAEGIRKRLSGI